MDNIEELLPGIEEFLAVVLASESLSNYAEDRRQFFLERLDIARLPPSVPPRDGRVLPAKLLQDVEITNEQTPSLQLPDFAATQRAISRSFSDFSPYQSQGTNQGGFSVVKGIKIYDDIDDLASKLAEDSNRQRSSSDHNLGKAAEAEDGHVLYEVPVCTLHVSTEDNSLSEGVESSTLSITGNAEDTPDDVPDSIPVPLVHTPPPLPPRHDLKVPESTSRESISAENKPPELPFRPPLPKRNELYCLSDRSEPSETEKSVTSDPELSGDGDSTSYESFDEDEDVRPSAGATTKFDVPLPKKIKKKSKLKRSRNVQKSRSPSQLEINVPFRKLENIEISGELFYKRRLKWKRRIAAISNGNLAVYRPEKNARPSLVIALGGCDVTLLERDGKRGYEMTLEDPNGDLHSFSVDVKDWAFHWLEHIKGNSKQQPPPKYHPHLARSYSEGSDYGTALVLDDNKTDPSGSNSNVSTEDGSEENSKEKSRGKKLTRMGSFAFRATQFLESIGKKGPLKEKSRDSSRSRARNLDHCSPSRPRTFSGMSPSRSRNSDHVTLWSRHSAGDAVEASKGLMESPMTSASSAGKLAMNLSPHSESSLSSVFGPSRSVSSPPSTPDDVDSPNRNSHDGRNIDDVIHQGDLRVFSSFNRRCWGTRRCLVKQHSFQCYNRHHSDQCELSFLLRPCELRRAVAETNSELGLMLVESGKEKITVEVLSIDEMGPWVQVLLRETSTVQVPDGLGEFLSQPEESLTNDDDWTWSRRHLSSHDYEDPEETVAAAAQLKNCCLGQKETESNYQKEQALSQRILVDVNDNLPDHLPISSQYQQVTDSGFYSVKGNHSASNSSCEDLADAGKVFEQIMSPKSSNNSDCNQDYSPVKHSIPGSVISETASKGNNSNKIVCSSFSQLSPSSKVSHQSVNQKSKSTSSVRSKNSVHDSAFLSNNSNKKPLSRDIKGSPLNNSKRPNLSIKDSSSASTTSRSGSSTSSNQTILSPSGEEYSVILKRSERPSRSRPSQTEARSSTSATPKTKSGTSGAVDDDVFTGSYVKENASRLNKITRGDKHVITKTSTKSSPSNEKAAFPRSFKVTETVAVACSSGTHIEAPARNIAVDFLDNSVQNEPPPLPRSPIPPLHSETKMAAITTRHVSQRVESIVHSLLSTDTSIKHTSIKNVSLHEGSTLPPEREQKIASSIEGEGPASPTADMMMALIAEPTTTPDDVNKAIDSLKSQLAEIKRKRMAVHEKRQRVLSDEERLVCEKEFAALEKSVETTDQNIRTLQNHLNTLQGQTMKAMKVARSPQKNQQRRKR